MSDWRIEKSLDAMISHIATTLDISRGDAMKRAIVLLSVMIKHRGKDEKDIIINDDFHVRLLSYPYNESNKESEETKISLVKAEERKLPEDEIA